MLYRPGLSHPPASPACLINFRSSETCSSRLTVCRRNSHPLTSPGPSHPAPGPLFCLDQTLPSRSFVRLFPLHLSLTRPWRMAPCPLPCFATLSFPLPLGRPAVFLCCVTLSKFLSLSEPVSPLVKIYIYFFLLTEHLSMCWVLC